MHSVLLAPLVIALASSSAVDHFKLARWCADRGHQQAMRAEALKVVALEPDHAGARELLGHVKLDGRWLPRADADKVVAARRARVVLEVRAARATLVSLKDRTVGLGTGTPVRLQLPTLRTVSIGTTVAVPVR